MTFFDASTGEPLRETKLRCVTGRAPVETRAKHKTDADGKLELELCTGDVRFSRRMTFYRRAKEAVVEWTVDGDELVVRIGGGE